MARDEINPANAALQKRLGNVRDHLECAIGDAADSIEGALAHAQIALDVLRQIVNDGRAAGRA